MTVRAKTGTGGRGPGRVPPSAYQFVQDEGTTLPQEPITDFVGGGVTATDDPANHRTLVTIPLGGGMNPPANPGDNGKVAWGFNGNLSYTLQIRTDGTYYSFGVGVGNGPALSGTLRFANTQALMWRNAAGTADVGGIAVDATNQLVPVATALLNGFMTAAQFTRLAGLPLPTTPAQDGYIAQAVAGALAWEATLTNAQHGSRGGAALHAVATALVNGFMSAADKAKADAQLVTLADIAALVALSTAVDTGYVQGSVIWMTTLRCEWLLDRASTTAPDAISVIAATGGAGNWLRQPTGFTQWNTQATWYIDTVGGSDEATGLVGAPLKTTDELARRLPDGTTLQQSTTITFVGTATLLRLKLFGVAGAVLRILGTATTLYSGTLTGKTDLNAAAAPNGQAQEVAAAAIGDWATAGPGATTLVGTRIRLTSGAVGTNGATAWIAKRLTATNARSSAFSLIDPTGAIAGAPATKLPAGNETFVCESLPTIVYLELNYSNGTEADSVLIDSLLIGAPNSELQLSYGGRNLISRSRIDTYFADVRVLNSLYLSNVRCSNGTVWCGSGTVVLVEGIVTNYFFNVTPGGPGWFFNKDILFQGVGLSIQGSQEVEQTGSIGCFDSGSIGCSVAAGSVLRLAGYLFGSGNTTYGVDTPAGALLIYGATKPIITGTTNDTRVAGTALAWAAHPAFATTSIPSTGAGIVSTATVPALAPTIVISPAALGASQNDYTPTDWATSDVLRSATTADGYSITGFAAATGRVLRKVVNVGAFNLTLANENAGSVAANRIIVAGGADLVLLANDSVDLFYDAVSTRWRVV